MLLLTCLLIALTGVSNAFNNTREFDCSEQPDGPAWWGCGAFGVCQGRRHIQTDCTGGDVYDRRSGSCTSPNQASFPCNSEVDCSGYFGAGHRYPEEARDPLDNTLPPCTFYYTCFYGRYIGHQMCSPGTVYDRTRQDCRPITLVPPPCGSFTGNPQRPIGQRPTNRFNNNNNNRLNNINNNNNRFNNNNNNNRFYNNNRVTTTTTTNRFNNNNNNNNKRWNSNNNRQPLTSKRPNPQVNRNNLYNQLYQHRNPLRPLFSSGVESTNFDTNNLDPALFGIGIDRIDEEEALKR